MAKRHSTARPRDIYQEVTDTILAELERGVAPWVKPWSAKPGEAGIPTNGATGHTYRGVNVPMLWGRSQRYGYASQQWFTYKQAQSKGGQVRKGEKGQMVVFWKMLRKEDENAVEKTIPMLRAYTVFNREQIDGLAAPEPVHGPDWEPLAA